MIVLCYTYFSLTLLVSMAVNIISAHKIAAELRPFMIKKLKRREGGGDLPFPFKYRERERGRGGTYLLPSSKERERGRITSSPS